MLNNSQTNETLSLLIESVYGSVKNYTITKNTLSEFLFNLETNFMDKKREWIQKHMENCNISNEKIQAVMNELPTVFNKQTMLDVLQKHNIGYFLNGALRYAIQGDSPYLGNILADLEADLRSTGQLDDKPNVLQEILSTAQQKQSIGTLLRENNILHDQNVIKEMAPLESLSFLMAGKVMKIFTSEFQNEDKINELFAAFEENQHMRLRLIPNDVQADSLGSSIKNAAAPASTEPRGAQQPSALENNSLFSQRSSNLPASSGTEETCYVM